MKRPSARRPVDVGDAVVALHNLGGFVRTTVPRGTAGVVQAVARDGAVHVRFSNGRILTVDPDDVVQSKS